LRDEGAQPVLAPTIRIAPPADVGPLRDAVTHLDRYDWVLFTSANAVEAFFDALADAKLDPRAFGNAKVCAIGVKTEAALRARAIVPDLVPEDARAEGVIAALTPMLGARARVLMPRAEVAREVLPDSMRKAGAEVDVVPAYRNLPPEATQAARIRELVDPAESDAVLFTSSSTVRNLVDLLGERAAGRLNQLALFSIGPITTKTASDLGLRLAATSSESTIESLVESLRAYYADGEHESA
jgi:uroporphyrinogen III methyltransferase/synthase